MVAAYSPVPTDAPVSVACPESPGGDPAYRWPWEIRDESPGIAHFYVEVVKVSLMPDEETFEGEDTEGDIDDGRPFAPSFPPDKPRFVSIVPDTPVVVDLLQLETGDQLTRLPGKITSVPVGTYDKIRVFYRNARVELKDGSALRFHPAAHSRFDIRFREGKELVIPVVADTASPDGWFKYFRVKLYVEGVKLKIVRWGTRWKGCRVILRPQIYAEAVLPTLDCMTGTADRVSVGSKARPVYGTFDVLTGGSADNVAVAFADNTTWNWSDNVQVHSSRIVAVSNDNGAASLRNGAIVEVAGRFDPGNVFLAEGISITFPVKITGDVYRGWNPDNFFQLRVPAGYSVYPQRNRYSAHYDSAAAPFADLSEAAIADNVVVTARGYAASFGAGVQAYWISVGP
jgi:hypothetical protein